MSSALLALKSITATWRVGSVPISFNPSDSFLIQRNDAFASAEDRVESRPRASRVAFVGETTDLPPLQGEPAVPARKLDETVLRRTMKNSKLESDYGD